VHFLEFSSLIDSIVSIILLLVTHINLSVDIRPFELESLSKSRNGSLFIMIKVFELLYEALFLLFQSIFLNLVLQVAFGTSNS
jgi:hypothetical protein